MDTSFIYGLLAGCVIGVLGQFLIQKFNDYRWHLDDRTQNRIDWEELFNAHTLFLNTLKKDIHDSDNRSIREFFVVEPHALLNSSIPRLRYELTEENLAAVNTLEEFGCVKRLDNNCLLYRMEEEFISHMRSAELQPYNLNFS